MEDWLSGREHLSAKMDIASYLIFCRGLAHWRVHDGRECLADFFRRTTVMSWGRKNPSQEP